MPHELSTNTEGKAEMFYTGKSPWHGLGVGIDEPANYATAIQLAGLGYNVVSEPVYDQHRQELKGQQLIRREDTQEIFKVLSDRYEIVQNVEAWGFMDAVLGAGQAVYHTAGALRGGRVMWVLAKRPGTAEVVTGDEVDKYLLLTTSHDGSLALQMATTPIRVVCSNTLRAAINHGRQTVSIKHTSSVHRQIKDAEKALAIGDEYFRDMITVSRQLAHTEMPESSFNQFIESLLNPAQKAPKPDAPPSYKDMVANQLRELFYTGRGQDIPKVRGTAWAAYNAVTEYVDYFSNVQKIDAPQGSLLAQDRRLHRSWYGRGQDTRDRAFHLLLDYRLKGNQAFPQPVGV